MGSIPVATPTPPRKLRFSRKTLVLLATLLGVLVGAAVLLAFAWPQTSPEPTRTWVRLGQSSDLAVNEPRAINDYRLFLVKLETGEILALSRRSTRVTSNGACNVAWLPDFEFQGHKGWFRDPCYQGTWSIDGTLVKGLAPRGTDLYPVSIVGDDVTVDVQTKLCGPGFDKRLPPTDCLLPDQYHGTPPK